MSRTATESLKRKLTILVVALLVLLVGLVALGVGLASTLAGVG